jgi:hypothetical protein
MEFSRTGFPLEPRPAACAASPVDFVAREIMRRHMYSDVCSGGVAQRDRAVAIMRLVFGAIWRTADDAKSVHDHLSRHHTGLIRERARFDISFSAGAYMPARGRRWPQMAVEQNEQSLRWPSFAALIRRLPLTPQPDGLDLDGLVKVISTAEPNSCRGQLMFRADRIMPHR